MLHQLPPREITAFGAQQTATFQIKASGKAFRILIDGLYSDKITAVVRELISNAIDSHTAAGCSDKPITLRIPTAMNPTFSVRDYGTGMSHETVMTNYSTLFDSTKENDDAQIGKLGLGSKSPFAYTDAFNLQCWDGASVRRYMIYINEAHVPVIDYVGSEASDEPRGVEVALAVEPSAFYDFRAAAGKIAIDLSVMPEFIGATAPEPRELISEGDGWKLFKSSGYGVSVYARQGQIVYAVDMGHFRHTKEIIDLLGQRSAALVLDFPPNTLGFTASREQLEYTPETVTAIEDKLHLFVDAAMAQHKVFLRSTKSRWQLNRAIADKGTLSIFQYLQNSLGIRHYGKKFLQSQFWLPKVSAGKAEHYNVVKRYDVVQYPTFRKNSLVAQSVGYKTRIYLYDTRKPEKNVVERVYEDMVPRGKADRYNGGCVIIRYASDIEKKRILVSLGRPPFIDVATLPPVQKITKDGTKREYTNGAVLKGHRLERCKLDLNAGGYYITNIRDEPIINGVKGATSYNGLSRMWETITEFAGLPNGTPLYVFSPSQAMKLVGREGWVSYDSMVVGLHRRFADRVAVASRLAYASVRVSNPVIQGLADRVLEQGDNVHPAFGTALIKIAEAQREVRSLRSAFEGYGNLAQVFATFGSTVTEDKDLRLPVMPKLEEAVYAEFPLLRHISSHADTDMIVNEYILR